MLRDLYSVAKNRSLSSHMIQVAVVLFLIESSWQVRGRSFAACEVLVRKRVFCVCGDNVVSADGVGLLRRCISARNAEKDSGRCGMSVLYVYKLLRICLLYICDGVFNACACLCLFDFFFFLQLFTMLLVIIICMLS